MRNNDRYNYDDILDLPYHKSTNHPPMSAAERAAQFLPFAALTGYDDEIKESARFTEQKMVLSEDAILLLNERLAYLSANLSDLPEVNFLIFKEDGTKSGGSYVHVRGFIKKIDEIEQLVIMKDGLKISIDDIVEINIEHMKHGFYSD